jgi:alpha-D-xyloside xylohydrolase
VTEPSAATRRLYLPATKWFDFWTGTSLDGGRTLEVAAPIDRIPLFVRSGSIIPLGPDEEWASEKLADPIELRVFRGADGDFTLYEDEGDNYNYEKGIYATIPLHWDDHAQTLTIGDRQGNFPGMLQARTFHVVIVGENHGSGIEPTAQADKIVQYSGAQITVTP